MTLPSPESRNRPSRMRSRICPVLGPSFPQPSNLNSFPSWQKSIKSLEQKLDHAVATDESKYGHDQYNETTFSLAIFNIYDEGLIWEKHYTDPSVANSKAGVHHVDANTLYQIGSVSKLMTAYILLIVDGDKSFTKPVSDYLPRLTELANAASAPYGVLPQWDHISVGDLASQLGGIADDYGLDDIEFLGKFDPPGFPPLPESRIPKCNYEIGAVSYAPCTVKQIIEGLSTEPALFAAGTTPSYANAGYDLVGAVIENITGVPLSESFNHDFAKALNLTHTFYYPPDPSLGAIPISLNHSGWNAPLAATIPDGGYFISTNDMATIGKSIMNSTLLPVPLTRRWLKPRTFTSDPTNFVGAPWEIYRWDTPNRLYDIYTKEGEVGTWATMFVLAPDLGIGLNAFTAAPAIRANAVENLANMTAAVVLPAAEDVAREQAHKNFGGRWSTTTLNSSVIITTDEQPGLKVASWISNGTNFLNSIGGPHDDSRLWPNQLYSGDKTGFTMSTEPLVQSGYVERPLQLKCETWGDTGADQYGNVPIGSFVFSIDQATGEATGLRLEALNIDLTREKGSENEE